MWKITFLKPHVVRQGYLLLDVFAFFKKNFYNFKGGFIGESSFYEVILNLAIDQFLSAFRVKVSFRGRKISPEHMLFALKN
jgi:hypothetical protein